MNQITKFPHTFGPFSPLLCFYLIMSIPSEQPIVSIDFLFNGELKNQIKITDPAEFDANQVSAEARVSNTTFGYSGRHDHGDLPKLKSIGVNAVLVSALQEAKRECDRYLTERINEEFGYDDAEKGMDVAADDETEENTAKKLCTEKSKSIV